jgi:hypothetical protein
MNCLSQNCILFAQKTRLNNLGDTFRGRSNPLQKEDLVIALCVLGGILFAVWLLSKLPAFGQRSGSYNSPRRLFRGLCRAHGLGWSERRLLWQLAQAEQLADPARLFLEPERFDEVHLNDALCARAAELKEIRQRLFCDPPTQDRAPPEANTPRAREVPAATPLLPLSPGPSLDVPPWTTSR